MWRISRGLMGVIVLNCVHISIRLLSSLFFLLIHVYATNTHNNPHTAHILRLLATHHVLREVTPNSDVFANNRISALLDTGKEVGALVGW
jgi:hypothetical protein